MNSKNNQTANSEAQCCADYCQTSFNVSGQEVVNSYKCNQKPFSASDMWNIQNQRKQVTVGLTITVE